MENVVGWKTWSTKTGTIRTIELLIWLRPFSHKRTFEGSKLFTWNFDSQKKDNINFK